MATPTPILWQELTTWPASKPQTEERLDDPFRATYLQTLRGLGDELRRIYATDVVAQIDIAARALRKSDGAPFARAETRDTPGIVLRFKSKEGHPVTIACDRFKSWEANLRAIVLTLEDLRRIDRYGTASSGEQYRGWAALPAVTTTAMNVEQAAAFLAKHSKLPASAIEKYRDSARDALRSATSRLHPDNGGRSGDFALATDAGRVLATHHKVEKL